MQIIQNVIKKVIQVSLISLIATQSVIAEEKQWKESYLLEAKGQYEQAADKLEQIIENNTRNEYIYLRMAWLNYLQANYNDAKSFYKKAMRVNPNSVDARLGIVKPLLAQQRWLEADKYNKQALNIAPLNITANLNQLAIDEHNKQWQALQKHASYLTSRLPTNTSVLVYLARAYAWQNNKIKAKKVYNQVLQRYTTNLEAKYYINNN